MARRRALVVRDSWWQVTDPVPRGLRRRGRSLKRHGLWSAFGLRTRTGGRVFRRLGL